jgi:hypothetical protein
MKMEKKEEENLGSGSVFPSNQGASIGPSGALPRELPPCFDLFGSLSIANCIQNRIHNNMPPAGVMHIFTAAATKPSVLPLLRRFTDEILCTIPAGP